MLNEEIKNLIKEIKEKEQQREAKILKMDNTLIDMRKLLVENMKENIQNTYQTSFQKYNIVSKTPDGMGLILMFYSKEGSYIDCLDYTEHRRAMKMIPQELYGIVVLEYNWQFTPNLQLKAIIDYLQSKVQQVTLTAEMKLYSDLKMIKTTINAVDSILDLEIEGLQIPTLDYDEYGHEFDIIIELPTIEGTDENKAQQQLIMDILEYVPDIEEVALQIVSYKSGPEPTGKQPMAS